MSDTKKCLAEIITVDELADRVESEHDFIYNIHKFTEDCVDVRLQVIDDKYYIRSGDSSFDTEHRGHWGYASMSQDTESQEDFEAIARELISGVEDSIAQM